MPIPLFLLDRIRKSAMSGPEVAVAFAKLATVADKTGIDGCAVNLEYVNESDRLIAGDLIPTITFTLKRQETAVEAAEPDKVINVGLQ